MSIVLTTAALTLAALMMALSATVEDSREQPNFVKDKAKAEIIRDAARAEIDRLHNQDRVRN